VEGRVRQLTALFGVSGPLPAAGKQPARQEASVERSRAASELTVFIVGFFAIWTLRATYGYAIDESIASPAARTVHATAVKFALWAVPALAFARWVRLEPPLRYLGVTVMPTARQWAWCLALTASFLAAAAAAETSVLGRKELALSGLTSAVLADAGGVFVFGLVAGWLYLKSSSIWPPTVAHIANNLLAALLVAVPR